MEKTYVSRGGIKLAAALEQFSVDPTGKICIDVGCSTGGFTDCLLQNGAKKVYAVDVGYGQFAWKLRQDPRVVLFERQNFRYFDPKKIPDKIQLAVIDVIFISLKMIFPALAPLLAEGARILPLIKPQFEVAKGSVGAKGIVTDPKLHDEVVETIKQEGVSHGWKFIDVIPSPILGGEGNKEFLMLFQA
ncbi:MAG: TlyA family RNA methyltransferase [Deltaproteobacteria bacterium]|nr:TlyA family RNA methyltransferase [Deltaproteobacteria bacterium]